MYRQQPEELPCPLSFQKESVKTGALPVVAVCSNLHLKYLMLQREPMT